MARWSVSEPCGIGARSHCASPPTGSPASPASRSPSALRAGSSTLDLALSGWPRCLNLMVLVKPATLVQWHRQGFRLYWRWRSRPGRPSVDRRVLSLYVDYYHLTRTHLSLDKDCPHSRCVQPPRSGRVIAIPQVGGLHHRSQRLAAGPHQLLPALGCAAAGITRSTNPCIDGV